MYTNNYLIYLYKYEISGSCDPITDSRLRLKMYANNIQNGWDDGWDDDDG
jgi:hypothetical protein